MLYYPDALEIEEYRDYHLTSLPRKEYNGRFSVNVLISRNVEGKVKKDKFSAHDGILYILEVEAAKESLNLGRNLIDRGLVGF